MELLTALRDTPLPTILVIVGSIFLLLAVVAQIGTYVTMTTQRQRWAAGIGGVLLILGIGLYLIPSQSLSPTPTAVSIIVATTSPPTDTPIPSTPTFAPTPTAGPTSTDTPTLTPTPYIIDTMDRLSSWKPSFCDDQCGGSNGRSSINVSLVPGRADKAIEISYDVKKYGWVLISKGIKPEVLSGAKGISFYYMGSGAPNTIELKLILRYPGAAADTTFGVSWNRTTDTGSSWMLVEVPYSDFTCWFDVNCDSYELDLTKVKSIDFAISNKPEYGDEAGSGRVAFDDVLGIQP